mmetsp:Transcript_56279/g.134299  ORF Transcript_56279/g.134299 Transcript_56279/m.134299 type:complete len:233 (+) Transcript_56279:5431-6129(+)
MINASTAIRGISSRTTSPVLPSTVTKEVVPPARPARPWKIAAKTDNVPLAILASAYAMTARAGSSPAEQDRGNCARSAGQWSPDRPTTSATVATRAISWMTTRAADLSFARRVPGVVDDACPRVVVWPASASDATPALSSRSIKAVGPIPAAWELQTAKSAWSSPCGAVTTNVRNACLGTGLPKTWPALPTRAVPARVRLAKPVLHSQKGPWTTSALLAMLATGWLVATADR